jgi:hypothetical protein
MGVFYSTLGEGRYLRCTVETTEQSKNFDIVPERVIINNKTTICIWKDGTKTTVTCSEDDEFVKEVGVAMCIIKKIFPSRSSFLKLVENAYEQPSKKEKKTKVSFTSSYSATKYCDMSTWESKSGYKFLDGNSFTKYD